MKELHEASEGFCTQGAQPGVQLGITNSEWFVSV